MKISALSVFFPAYNEEANLERTVKSSIGVLKKVAAQWEVIIINDGSTDKTGEIARELSKQDDRIRVINHKENLGYGEALKSGFYNARYDVIAYTDSDGQFDFSESSKFIEKLDTADLIIGYRIKRQDPFFRLLFAKGWALSLFTLFGLKLRDVDCGFKMVKKRVLEQIPHLESKRGGMINAELAVKAKKFGFNVVEVGVNHYPRLAGRPTGANIKVIIQSYIDLFKIWWKFLPKLEFFALLTILIVGAFLRFYRLSEYMTFLGDEGRDAIVVRRLLVDFDPILVGPGTSIGNMYLGPLYYYLIAPALFLFRLSPVGPVAQVAALGVATTGFVWWVSREWFGKVAAVVAASLYAVSPVVITYSRSSWNPNIMPFFALLSIYSVWRVWKHHAWKWLLVLGVSYAFVLQSHYLGLLLAPTIGLFWLLTFQKIRNSKINGKFILYTLIASALFALLMSPLVIFDARHGWRNFEAMRIFFTERQATVSARPWNAIPELWPLFQQEMTRLVGAMNELWGRFIAVVTLIGTFWIVAKQRQTFFQSPSFLLLVWVGFGLSGMALLKQNIYDHYFGFMFVIPFFLLGMLAQEITNYKLQITNFLLFAALVFLILLNLSMTPIKNPPQRQLQRTGEVAAKIVQEAKGQTFNLAVLAERNYEDAYQYFLEWWKEPVRDIDPLKYEETVAEQLFVVCELPQEKCDPTHNPKAEITVFGWSKIDKEWDVAGVKLYRLVHNPSGKP
ncbi:glycosyltransferase [Candidatus Microgenomates bacterium]|nr:glycosyltransferase [Candidatus Microgenomates bacterium]